MMRTVTPIHRKRAFNGFLAILLFIALTACQSAYYAAWESLGKEKRHLLKDEVENVRADQKKTSEEFKDVLTRIKALYGFDGGDLEDAYEKLKDDYDDCRIRANALSNRIDQVERIAGDLFDEWKTEIEEIENPKFRRESREKLAASQRRYKTLRTAMRRSESSMTPVLKSLNDYVLYLKHNLNAMAVGALKSEVDSIELDVHRLVADMNRSIEEADAFLKTL
ncbi:MULTISPECIES: DUF2959 domain-containing protein [Desulfococcus]|jgi:hypothetical protein|nr:DUF2959 domain-containing protein [Desulfococcus multivorans]MDX9818241.1 DUF2959 domain-containing protein [Desulfococcus multivorans]